MICHAAPCIGQIVPTSTANVSKAVSARIFYSAQMSEEASFNESLCARVHQLRNERGWTSAQMATALGVPPDRYRKYEYRSPLPAYLMERFSLIVGCDVDYLLTGKSRKAANPSPLAQIGDLKRA
jgi:DNA-binding XRE family transcriptional regulator